ncbi:MAG: hypothetical protein V8Q54_05685 [Alistipes senegalensis]
MEAVSRRSRSSVRPASACAYLPVVGMLGIDWGYGFDPPANSTTKSGSQFHFVLGQQF